MSKIAKNRIDWENAPHFQYLGRKSNEMNMLVRKEMELIIPQSLFETVDVDGRNNDIILDRDKYQDVDKVFPMRLYKSPDKNIAQSLREIAAWLYASKEYSPLVFSPYDEYFYKGFAYNGTTAEDSNVNNYWIDIDFTFKVQPFSFRVDGEEVKKIQNGNILINPEEFKSYPLIEFTLLDEKKEARFYINGRQFTFKGEVLKNGTYVIDNELGIAYNKQTKQNVSKSVFMTNAQYEPLLLDPGRNVISYANMTDVKITPRWRTLTV